jgi:hypothetical protein
LSAPEPSGGIHKLKILNNLEDFCFREGDDKNRR